jgi:iron complex outermembrane receptor protein
MEAQWRIANFGRKIARQEGPSRRFQLYCTLSAKYVGKQYLDNTSNEQSQLTGYGFSDLRINVDCLKFLGTKTSFILSVNNISDAKYSTNGWIYRYLSATYDARLDNPYTVLETGNTYHQAGYFPQAGRHWMATVRVEF